MQTNRHYPVNRPPLLQTSFVALPLGAVRPRGWLKDQLEIQARGLTGHLDEFWKIRQSVWKGDPYEWETADDYAASCVPNYLEGLVPLAHLLEDERLIEKANRYVQWILSSWQSDGWFGSPRHRSRIPQTFITRMLTEHCEVTGDLRVIPLLTDYFTNVRRGPARWPHGLLSDLAGAIGYDAIHPNEGEPDE